MDHQILTLNGNELKTADDKLDHGTYTQY